MSKIFELKKLTKEKIINNFLKKPLLIGDENGKKEWYICVDIEVDMPVHMLSIKETEKYEKDNSYTEGIKICGEDTEDGYCLWYDFDEEWVAYGYCEKGD